MLHISRKRTLFYVFVIICVIIIVFDSISENRYVYLEAKQNMDCGQYYLALKKFERLDSYKDSKLLESECRYLLAKENEFDDGPFKDYVMISLLEDLDYKDSRLMYHAADVNLLAKSIPYLKENDLIEFGRFEQDGNVENGAERIEWKVIDCDNEIILLSKTILGYLDSTGDKNADINNIKSWLNAFYSDVIESISSELSIEVCLLSDEQIVRLIPDDYHRIGVSSNDVFLTQTRYDDVMHYRTNRWTFFDGTIPYNPLGEVLYDGTLCYEKEYYSYYLRPALRICIK